ncbi:B12-binding domain-containing radical SAM protein [Chloroflexota bacterium]
MRVLLLMPPHVPGFSRNARWEGVQISGSWWYPIYLAYGTALLEREKHEARLVDAPAHALSHEETYRIAQEFSPELTVLNFSVKSLENDLMVAGRIQELTGSEIVLVGPSSYYTPAETLKQSAGVRWLAKGEFDFTVLDLANKVPEKEIKGLFWKNDEGEVVENPPREPVSGEELDKFPFVTDVYRRHLDIWKYRQSCHPYPYVDLFTGRGCAWGKCTFCFWPHTINKGVGYRKRKIENVIEELRFVKEEMPYIKEVYLQDDTLPKERAIELSEAILENKLKIRWSCYSRANLDFQTLKLMKKAGCHILETGFESHSQEILKNIKKGITVSGAEEYIKNARKVGLEVIGAFITGLPGETVETIKATTEWARRLPCLRYTIEITRPYPGTPLYQWLEEQGCLNDGKPDYPHLSTEEIYRWNKWSLNRVFFSLNYLFRVLTRPGIWGSVIYSAKHYLPYALSRKKSKETELGW